MNSLWADELDRPGATVGIRPVGLRRTDCGDHHGDHLRRRRAEREQPSRT